MLYIKLHSFAVQRDMYKYRYRNHNINSSYYYTLVKSVCLQEDKQRCLDIKTNTPT